MRSWTRRQIGFGLSNTALDSLLERFGEQPLVLHIGEPRPAGLVHRVRYVVPVLLHLALEQAQLRTLERRADHSQERY